MYRIAGQGGYGHDGGNDISSVVKSIARELKNIGLFVQSKSWTISTDSEGVIIRMNWLHAEDKTACKSTGHTDSGVIHGRPRKKKSPSKAKRDRERWVAYKNGIKSQHGSKDSDTSGGGMKQGMAGNVPHIVPPETVCTASSSLNVCAAEFTPREDAPAKPSTTRQHVISNSGDIQLHSDTRGKLSSAVQVIPKIMMDNDTQTETVNTSVDNDCQTDTHYTRSIDVMTDRIEYAHKDVQVSVGESEEVQDLRHELLNEWNRYHTDMEVANNMVRGRDEQICKLRKDLESNASNRDEIAQLKTTITSLKERIEGHETREPMYSGRPTYNARNQNNQWNRRW